MSINCELAFKETVENIFNRWTALKLAVEHGMGGRKGHQSAIEIMNYITDFCIQNNNLTSSDVEECLEVLMDEEFETICEDNSIEEISILLIKYLNMCREGRFNELEQELSKLPPVTKWVYPGAKITYANIYKDSSDDSSDSEMDEDIPSCSTSNTVPLTDPDGWTTVPSRKQRK